MGLIISDAFLKYSNKTFSDAEIQEMFEPITSRYGIRIVYEVGDDFLSDIVDPFFPVGPDPESKVLPIRHRVLARYPGILNNALEKYPDKVIKQHLKAIYFAKTIDDDGFQYGASYDQYRKIIYLVNDGRTSDNLEENHFHHEFSSLLLARHLFFIHQWKKANPSGFKYLYELYGNYKSLPNSIKKDKKETDQDYKEGFVSKYGRTNLENDFNTYSGMIFTYPKKFNKIMSEYPRVREKFKIWLEFYHQIDTIFTEEYLLGGDQKKTDKGSD